MTDIQYDASALFDIMPSFWRSYPDRQVLETVYGAYLRLADADYASLFTDDDNKDLFSLQGTRYQPLHYQVFDAWETLSAPHNHLHHTEAWPDAVALVHTLKVPGVALGTRNLLFVDDNYLPPFLYRLEESWWVEDNEIVRGTKVQIDSRKLATYFSQGAVGTATAYSRDDLTIPVDLSTFTTARLTSFDHREIITQVAEPDNTEYTFGPDFDIAGADVFIEFVDIFRDVEVEYTPTGLTLTLPKYLGSAARGILEFASGNRTEVALASGITLPSTYGDRVTAVYYYVGFKLNSQLTISTDSIRVDGTAFAAGTTVTVNNKPLTSTTLLEKSSPVVNLECGPVSELTEVRYFGTDIRSFAIKESVPTILDCGDAGMTDQMISFKSALTKNTTFKVLIAKHEDHAHVREELTAPTAAGGTVTLSQPLKDLASPLLFINDRCLTETTDYVVNSATEIQFVDGYGADVPVDIYYEVSTPVQHNHVLEQQSVSGNIPSDRYELKQPYLESQPMLTFTASNLKGEDTRTDQTVLFPFNQINGTLYTYLYPTTGRKYRHLIPYIEEEEYNYRGRLESAARLSDGIDVSSVDLGPDDFEIVDEGSHRYVYTDQRISAGFWKDARICEDAVPRAWGTLVGLEEGCSPEMVKAIGILIAALRAPSSGFNIDNYGSILLGSAFTSTEGYFAGTSNTATGVVANIRSTDPLVSDYTLPVSECSNIMLSTGRCLPRLSAVNRLVTTRDIAKLDEPWMAMALETLSADISFATRLDRSSVKQITSAPFSYDENSRILVDYSVDFEESGVGPGSLLRARFGYTGVELDSTLPSVFLTLVKRRLSKHMIEVEIVLTPPPTSYGDGGYSDGTWSGIVPASVYVQSYTVWGIDTRRQDVGSRMDRLDPRRFAALKNVAAAFNFAVQIDWSTMTAGRDTDWLRLLLEKVRPVDTQYFAYTEAFSDICSSPLKDTLGTTVRTVDPEVTFEPNTLFMEESFVGLAEVIQPSADNEALYNGACPTYGTFVTAVVERAPVDLRQGEYVITSGDMYSDAYANTYSTARGLENELYQIVRSGPLDTYALVGGSATAPRAARGIRLGSGAYIEIDAQASDFAGVNRSFEYVSGQQFTINIWIDLTAASHTVGNTPTLFSWGDIEIDLEAKAGGAYTPRAKVFSASPIESNTDVLVDTTNLITLTYGQPVGQNYYEEILYVNGAEVARSTSTNVAATTLASFTSTGYIGRNTAGDASAQYESGLLLFDMRAFPMTATNVVDAYNAGTGVFPPIGIDLVGKGLHYPDALVTYQFHSTFTAPVIPDYSTNAFNAQLSGTTTFITGGLLTSLAQPGDNHIITKYVGENGAETYVPKASVYAPTLNRDGATGVVDADGNVYAGGADINDNSLTLSRDGGSYILPNVGFSKQADHTWARFAPDIVYASASIEVDTSDLYTGFTQELP